MVERGGSAVAAPGRVAWGPVLVFAAIGTLFATVMCLVDVSRTSELLGHLVVTSEEDPSAEVLVGDGLESPLSENGRHDGAYFYAMSRDLWDLDAAASHMDRSHYRMQRVLFPLLGHLVHPSPGPGLAWTLFGIGVAGIFLGGVATGAISGLLRGPPWVAVVFGMIPAGYLSLRLTVPDPLAVGFALWSVYFVLRRRIGWAVVAGVLAVLTKESTWLVLAGMWMWRRERDELPVVVVPAAAAAAWWAFLRLTVEQQGEGVIELTAPLTGWIDAIRFWGEGNERMGMLMAVVGTALVVIALVRRGLAHPFGWILLGHLLLLSILIASAIAPERSAGRTLLAPVVLAVVALTAPPGRPEELSTADGSTGGTVTPQDPAAP